MIKPLVLCILDGVGIAPPSRGNAVSVAKMPYYKSLLARYPTIPLIASGEAVGLPPKTAGNSEVGHITIGSGRTVNQYLRRFQLEDLRTNRPLGGFIRRTRGAVHILGLASDGRVHSDIMDAIKVARIVQASGRQIIWHFVADGRDTPMKSALGYVKMIRRALPGVIFGSLSGRYYAMDRDNNWERTDAAWDAIAGKAPVRRARIEDLIRESYNRGITDEFIKPTRIAAPVMTRSDGLLFFNFRSDRARQILRLVVKSGKVGNLLCFSQYGEGLNEYCPALLSDVPVKNTLGDVLASAGLSQLRLAETEKYNYATYCFDAERTIDYPNEKKILIPSPKVATFDLMPEMAAPEITREFLANVGKFDVIIMNYANGDMVGHTGNMKAAVRALETLDGCLARIVPAALKAGGAVLLTADHGNIEKMKYGFMGLMPWTAHTANPVWLTAISNQRIGLKKIKGAGLANIAPTMLKLLGIKPPREMAAPLA